MTDKTVTEILQVNVPTPDWTTSDIQTGSYNQADFIVNWGALMCSIGSYPFAQIMAFKAPTPENAHIVYEVVCRSNFPPGMRLADSGFIGDESVMYLLDPDMGPPENNCVLTFRMGNACIWMFTGKTGASSEIAHFFAEQTAANINPTPPPPPPASMAGLGLLLLLFLAVGTQKRKRQ